TDPPASVGWKLVAVNLSDLAAKGAEPAGGLLSLTMSGPEEWTLDFLAGVEAACESYGLPLIGCDTIALPHGAARVLGLTASGCGARIGLESLPLSRVFIAERGNSLLARLFAATGGDDYALLAALPPDVDPSTLSLPEGTTIGRIGNLVDGPPAIRLTYEGHP